VLEGYVFLSRLTSTLIKLYSVSPRQVVAEDSEANGESLNLQYVLTSLESAPALYFVTLGGQGLKGVFLSLVI